jgi:two-component system phosphate regulon sensor histidine kinase PhoR
MGYSLTPAEIIQAVARQLNTSLDLNEVLGKVLRLTVEATGAARGSLFLLDEEGQVTRRILARPNQSPEVLRQNIKLVMTQGLSGWVYRNRQGALVDDVIKDERWVRLPGDNDFVGSALVVPLLYRERVNGILSLHHEQVGFFDETHLDMTIDIASQAAIAVENARLFTQVKAERESLYALVEAMPIPVLVIDSRGYVSFANQTARQSLLVKTVNVPLADLTGGDQLKGAQETLRFQTEKRLEVPWPDGRVFNVSMNNVPQVGTVVALSDITQLKELDEMKSQFVETVSHDLKNPLGVILGFANILQRQMGEGPYRSSVDAILHSAGQMKVLIENLLDLAQIEAGLGGQIGLCDLIDITRNVLVNLNFQVEEKGMVMVTDFPPSLPPVQGNEVRLSQVVSNFVSNAIKYTPAGGRIEVKINQVGSEIWLRVIDTGPGISPAAQAQLFQKFYRVPEIQARGGPKGTGLGLSIVKAIVEKYNGRVFVESEVGVGSTFGCVLPAFKSR